MQNAFENSRGVGVYFSFKKMEIPERLVVGGGGGWGWGLNLNSLLCRGIDVFWKHTIHGYIQCRYHS